MIGEKFTTTMKKINDWVYAEYKEHMKKTNNNIDNKLIKKWGLEAKKKFWNKCVGNVHFNASGTWVTTFKRNYLRRDRSDNTDVLDVQQDYDGNLFSFYFLTIFLYISYEFSVD